MTPPRLLTVIPARFASTRFPGKPLALLQGKPMILHTVERVLESDLATGSVVVATDDERIAAVVQAAGHRAMLTSPTHETGSDRIWEVAQRLSGESVLPFDWVVNVQGDEPFIPAEHLNATLAAMHRWQADADIITLVCPLVKAYPELEALQEAVQNPNCVKAVLASSGQALYFSRSAVPMIRDHALQQLQAALSGGATLPLYRHVGLYAYRFEALRQFVALPPSPLERLEKLEQLRALEAGLRIYAAEVPSLPTGVDTPDDLALLEALG